VTRQFRVAASEHNQRLDQFLVAHEPSASRSLIKKHIDEGRVRVAGQVAKAARKLHEGDEVVYDVPAPEVLDVVAEDLPLDVLYEDSDLIVINKEAGRVVHPSAGHARGTLVNALLFHCRDLSGIGGVMRPGIVHRLDKDTSGVLVAAKNDFTHTRLAAMFKDKTAERVYLAVVAPPPVRAAGTIDTAYGRHPHHRQKFSSRVREGKRAVTVWRVVERWGRAALLECRLKTGRTHQIRVHCADHGFPVLGDRVYARRPGDPELAELARTLGRQALHAAVLAFAHPRTGAALELEAPLPADLQRVLNALRAGPTA